MTNENQNAEVQPRGAAPAERMLDQISQAIEKQRMQKLKQSITPLIEKDLALKKKIKDAEKALAAEVVKVGKEIEQNALAITEFLVDEEMSPEVLARVLS